MHYIVNLNGSILNLKLPSNLSENGICDFRLRKPATHSQFKDEHVAFENPGYTTTGDARVCTII